MNQQSKKGKNKLQLLLSPSKLEKPYGLSNRTKESVSYYQHHTPRTILPSFTPQKNKPQISFQEVKNSPYHKLISSIVVRNKPKVAYSPFKGNFSQFFIQSRVIQNEEFKFTIQYIAKTRKGMQLGNAAKINQDTYICSANINDQTHLFAVCDGHGENGHLVSGFIKASLPFLITQNKSLLEKNPSQALMIMFQSLSDKLKSMKIDISYSGSTINIVYIDKNKLYCANLGDSRAVLLNRLEKWRLKQLSRDHKPNCSDEAERILSIGGRIEQLQNNLGLFVGPLRVWANQNGPGLAMTRSLGDEIAHTVGVSDKPEINQFDLEKSDKVLILGSDGLFEFLGDEQLINSVSPHYDSRNLEGACNQLMLIACNSWMQKCCNVIDDITFVMIFFQY